MKAVQITRNRLYYLPDRWQQTNYDKSLLPPLTSSLRRYKFQKSLDDIILRYISHTLRRCSYVCVGDRDFFSIFLGFFQFNLRQNTNNIHHQHTNYRYSQMFVQKIIALTTQYYSLNQELNRLYNKSSLFWLKYKGFSLDNKIINSNKCTKTFKLNFFCIR